MKNYVGQTVQMADDWYLCSNYSRYYISPRRIFSPTNQALPLSSQYNTLLTLNAQGTIALEGINEYHRTGERLHNLVVRVNSTYELEYVSGEWVGNKREDILKGYDPDIIDRDGEHTLLICGANLEYYLVDNLGTGYGPDNAAAHAEQRNKVSQALALINADIYGLVEVERGQAALQEIADDLTRNTGRRFGYINDGGQAYGSYTKSGFVYCTETVQPYSTLRGNQTGVNFRKYMQCFEDKQSGERMIVSINHFKAKAGSGSGLNADQGDGQGNFNADRVAEAKSVLSEYNYWSTFVNEKDILILGDLNAYAMEDPIRILTNGGMTDLHRYYHADTSYSYTYRSEAGYLDYAMCNTTMLRQICGMQALHINSDEHDAYTYDGKKNDGTMFRYSDHDPILVGVRLGTTTDIPHPADLVYFDDPATLTQQAAVQNAYGGWVKIYTINGECVLTEHILSDYYTLPLTQLPKGLYILHIYHNGNIIKRKLLCL
jgi:predicted extracellular nuclease